MRIVRSLNSICAIEMDVGIDAAPPLPLMHDSRDERRAMSGMDGEAKSHLHTNRADRPPLCAPPEWDPPRPKDDWTLVAK